MEFKITQVRKLIAKSTDILRQDKALAAAEKIAGRDGYIMTVPQHIDARLAASLGDPIWQHWVAGFSEEDHGRDKQGNKLYVVSHGRGPLLKSRRLKKAIESSERLPYGYARLADREFASVVKHAIPLEEVKGKNLRLSEPYTLVGKVDSMNFHLSGLVSLDDLWNEDRFLMAVGSEQRRHAYLDKMAKEFQWQRYGNWHRIEEVNYGIPQGRVLFVNNSKYGLDGSSNLYYDGRWLGVSAGGTSRAERVRQNSLG